MLASSPIRVRDEQWAWVDGRWMLADMSKSFDFLHILSKADALSAQLTTFAEDLRRRSGLLVSQTLRQEVYQLLLRFTTVRARFVADVVEAGLGIPGLRDLHPEAAIIGRIYASECAFLPGFLKSVEDQLDTEGITHRQDWARGLLLEGFLVRRSSLHSRPPGGGALPMAPNPLDDTSPSAVGTSTAAPVSSHALVQTSQVAPASLLAPVSSHALVQT
jgi:hypothetical protein